MTKVFSLGNAAGKDDADVAQPPDVSDNEKTQLEYVDDEGKKDSRSNDDDDDEKDPGAKSVAPSNPPAWMTKFSQLGNAADKDDADVAQPTEVAGNEKDQVVSVDQEGKKDIKSNEDDDEKDPGAKSVAPSNPPAWIKKFSQLGNAAGKDDADVAPREDES